MSNTDPRKEMLPSEKAEKQAEVEAMLKERAAQTQAMLREDFGMTFQTENGMRVLAWLADRCGWGKPPLAADTHKNIDPLRTTHNAMELSLYLAIRAHIPIDVLQQVEYGQIKPSGVFDDGEDTGRKTSKSKAKKKGN